MRNEPSYIWPREDFTRIPYGVYHDRELYDGEQHRIFRGPTWSYLCFEAEVPNPGDFKCVHVGDTPVVVSRDKEGVLHAFVNRCAHRGSIVRREEFGNAREHQCVYHQWCYDLAGNLMGVPFRRGVKGKGGLPRDFDTAEHGLRKLRVESFHGIVFGTLSGETEPLEDYLDEPICNHLRRLMHKPVKILGYQRQFIHGNWKLYTDNTRDPNHGGLLHPFQVTFGIARLTHRGGAVLDTKGRHNISLVAEGTDSDADASRAYQGTGSSAFMTDYRLLDTSMLGYRKEYDDDFTLSILSIFPNVVFQQIENSLATRQIRCRGVDAFELYWTYYGYEDDDEAMTGHRLRQANMAGPGGLISMEDGEAVEIVHRGIKREGDMYSVAEYGGRGEIKTQDTLITEVPLRGFWANYCQLMDIEPERAAR